MRPPEDFEEDRLVDEMKSPRVPPSKGWTAKMKMPKAKLAAAATEEDRNQILRNFLGNVAVKGL